MTASFYELLGVNDDASRESIESAYRERAKEWHPDVNDRPDAAERFKTIQRAEAVLTDPVERRRYDRLGHEAYCSGRPDGSGGSWQSQSDRGQGPSDGGADQRRRESPTDATADSKRGATDDTDRSAASGTDASTATGSASRENDGGRSGPGPETNPGDGGDPGGSSSQTGGPTGQRSRSRDSTGAGRDSGSGGGSRWSYRAAGDGGGPWSDPAPGATARSGSATVTGGGTGHIDPTLDRPGTLWDAVRGELPSRDRGRWLFLLSLVGSGRLLGRRRAVELGALIMYPYPFLLRGAGEALSGPLGGDPRAVAILALFVGFAVFVSGFPNVGMLFFGSWGVVVPALLWESPHYTLGSEFGIAVTAACWLPVAHSLLVVGLLWREGELV